MGRWGERQAFTMFLLWPSISSQRQRYVLPFSHTCSVRSSFLQMVCQSDCPLATALGRRGAFWRTQCYAPSVASASLVSQGLGRKASCHDHSEGGKERECSYRPPVTKREWAEKESHRPLRLRARLFPFWARNINAPAFPHPLCLAAHAAQ